VTSNAVEAQQLVHAIQIRSCALGLQISGSRMQPRVDYCLKARRRLAAQYSKRRYDGRGDNWRAGRECGLAAGDLFGGKAGEFAVASLRFYRRTCVFAGNDRRLCRGSCVGGCVQGRELDGAVEGAVAGVDSVVRQLRSDLRDAGIVGARSTDCGPSGLRLGEMRRCISVDECVKRSSIRWNFEPGTIVAEFRQG